MSLDDWPHNATADEVNAYNRGYSDGRSFGVKRGREAQAGVDRVKTFGAIRRAVVFARGLDASANELGATSMAAEVRRERARTIRSIIRTAIGSQKS